MKTIFCILLLFLSFTGLAQKLDTARTNDVVKDKKGFEGKVVAILEQPFTGQRVVVVEDAKKKRKLVLNSDLIITKRAARKKK